jgi:cellulose 1,4-beta-cellobiosidase
VAKVGSFLWLDTIARVPLATTLLAETPSTDILGLVVYDLPGRDCFAKASNGELATGQLAKYKSDYIDPIAAAIKAAPQTAVALIIEPDSLPNLVTNANATACAAAASDYKDGVAYALKTLNFPNVAMYIDAGHGGWLGWDANLQPGADMISGVYKAAGSPSQVFGISTNVAGWNAWSASPGEFSGTTDAKYNKCQDEKRYINAISPLISAGGMPAHAIIDTGRNAIKASVWNGVTGVTSTEPVSVFTQPLPPVTLSLMLLFGLSPVERVTELVTPLPTAMILSAERLMHSNLPHKPEHGTRRTLRCFLRTPILHSKRLA